ncbi:hypothetical protein EIP86_006930 [Pleurotus ostreatoroseus]|nr:hypothetical protein EIP86_006930 [Pleurotus ostreatoroseus]
MDAHRYGNPLGPIQGVGYANELIARLTGRPPTWDNTTHDPSRHFPLDRAMYVDFTHENLMVAVYSAIGLFNVSEPLDPKHMPARPDALKGKGRKGGNGNGNGGDEGWDWTASRMVPFSARMVTERLACSFEDPDGGDDDPEADGEYVRIFVNDELQPLEFCRFDKDGEDEADVNVWKAREGLCLLEDFVESQTYARGNGGGDFEKCWK